MRIIKIKVLVGIMGIFLATANSKDAAGLVFTGVDTIRIPTDGGFDFFTKKTCATTSQSGQDCFRHISIYYLGTANGYDLLTNILGHGVQMGKMNLDSIVQAPEDTVFNKYPWSHIDSIPPDNLDAWVGNCYVIKTGTDPRMDTPFRAKFKILEFIVHDAAAHEIDMVFLWACNIGGNKGLATAIDTFDLDTTPVSNKSLMARPSKKAYVNPPQLQIRQSGGSVGVRVTEVVAGRQRVFDLRGRGE